MTIDFGSYLGTSAAPSRSTEVQNAIDATFGLIKQHNASAGMVINVVYNDVNGFDADYCPRVIDKTVANILMQRVAITLEKFLTQGLTSQLVNPLSTLNSQERGVKFNVLLKFQEALGCGHDGEIGDSKYDHVMTGADHSQVRIFTNLSRELADGSSLVSRYDNML
jgi:malate synthase